MKSTLWQRLFRGVRRIEQQPDWVAALGNDWTDTIMLVAVTDDFHAKQGRSTGRWLIEANGQRLAVYLKRHYRLSWWRGVLAAIFPKIKWSPALQEWDHLHWALRQGLAVPRPVAAVEFIGPAFRLQSMLAIEELSGMLPLHQAIPLAQRVMEPAKFQRWKRGLIRELARLSRELHRRNYYHKDLYLCHFYLPRADIENWNPAGTFKNRLHLIDLHRLGHHPWSWPVWQLKDLAQLLYSTDSEGVTPRDRIRFWRLYRGEGKRTGWLRWAEWCIRLKWLRYRDHNQKRERRTQTKTTQKKAAA